MGNQKNNRHVLIDGQMVQLSYEEQKVWFKMVNEVRREARNYHCCGQSDFRMCTGDCATCPWQTEGLLLHLDDEQIHCFNKCGSINGLKPVCAVQTPDGILSEQEANEKLFTYARNAFPQGDRILDLSVNSGCSSYQIARETGLSQSSVTRHLKKMLAYIRQHRDEFFD